ncbi:hypothetical protein GCM10011348_46400 [Marinobacterium nitratireducens]|uniref:Uncharacterized protein n=1 Tax=Marinobacterium nitratireducens TaxID=518897 RepID=A0A917ZSA5_9GAMM|nr:hypothetical protein [Marinobacterium nitratireducens]GGO89202.1 hypothetical protein GCM10011348_46400 [Marinobacterium nitratireducens]
MSDGILTEVDLRDWHPASTLPTPGAPLIVRLDDGSEVDAIRPRYVESYSVDPDYRDMCGNQFSNVREWSIK